jgi:hypothetical protein
MNPLLFKAHPLQWLTVDMLIHPSAHSLGEFAYLLLVYLALNAPWAAGLMWAGFAAAGTRVAYARAYLLGLPSLILSIPLVLTILSDVVAHAFSIGKRFILVFALFVALQMSGVLFGTLLKQPRTGRAIGMHAGLAVALLQFLLSLPYGLALLWLSAWLRIF